MNKKWGACYSRVTNGAKFCHVCEGVGFKKKKTGVLGIVAAIMIMLAGCGAASDDLFQEPDSSDSTGNIGDYDFSMDFDTSDYFEDTSEKVYYTKGTFDGSVYINKWADIKFELPEGFSDADLAIYNSAENSNTECGMYFMADDTTGLVYICYEKLPSSPVYDEEEYLDAVVESLRNISGVPYEFPSAYATTNIGGYTYAKAECAFNNGNGDFSHTFYVRKLDNYMIVISAIGVNADSIDSLVSNIATAK